MELLKKSYQPYTLQEMLEDLNREYNRNSRLYSEEDLRRFSLMFEDRGCIYGGFVGEYYVEDVLIADMIIGNINAIWEKDLLTVKKSLKAVLRRSRKIRLTPNEWQKLTEIAQRVNNSLPNILVVPNNRELYQMKKV